MLTVYSLIQNKVHSYISAERSNNQSAVGSIIQHIEKQKKLRIPQEEAIEVYLWLKFVGQNKKLSEIVKAGLLFDETEAKKYEYYSIFQNSYITTFLNQFAQDNNLKNLTKQLLNDPQGETHNWENILADLLHNFDYPNYLFSLPMGAGKTYLMAAFIYLDLFFANLNRNDRKFAHNFVVFAPSASKTAILPSLQTIKNFNPEWILPKQEADRLKQIIHIEILDSLSSQRKDKLHGNNPNLEKVNRLTHINDFGLVFITNAEKVVLEKLEDKGKLPLFDNEKESSEIAKINELREKLSKIPYLTVILDEVHHTYGKFEDAEKKLRQAVNILNQNKNVVSVIGLSGTPYVRHTITIGDSEIKLNQIQDIVYNYSLADGIGKFLKIPIVKGVSIKEEQFIHKALDEFFSDYDITYADGTKSKIAFYCPTIPKLNNDILPAVQNWYSKNRSGKEPEIFRFYSSDHKKEYKQYQLPKDSLAIFNNLDKPYSDKRVVLLVAVGKEGWDCKSLTSVVLPRQKTTKNFVLQTTCRCLREVTDSSKEKALVYLDTANYETLDAELKENYDLRIEDLTPSDIPAIPVKVRKPQLGRLQYKQIYKKYSIVTKQKEPDYATNLKSFRFDLIKDKLPYTLEEKNAQIGKKGLVHEVKSDARIKSEVDYSLTDLIYDIAKYSYGKFSENELLNSFGKELSNIHKQIMEFSKWIEFHPFLEYQNVAKYVTSYLMESLSYKEEIIEEDTEVELLEWRMATPMIQYAGGKFLPDIKPSEAGRIGKRPQALEWEFEDAGMDPHDMSFNYIPYRMDSDFERNALRDLLKESAFKGLEVYYNGYSNLGLDNFYIKTGYGNYTPDFLVIKRKDGRKYKNKDDKGTIERVLIIETKGKIYYNDDFKNKEKFVKETFLKHNPKFKYVCFVDDEEKNNFSKHLDEARKLIQNL